MNQQDIAEHNLERLLETAYKPEEADPVFAQSVAEYLCDVARDLAAERQAKVAPQPAPADDPVRLRRLRRRFGWGMALAASLLLCALVLYGKNKSQPSGDEPHAQPKKVINDPNSVDVEQARDAYFGQTAQARLATEAAKPLPIGETITTKAGERRRVSLPDGSVLFLNQNTAVTQVAQRELKLRTGEVYLEVFPDPQSKFLVKTPRREVTALGTRFAVQAEEKGTGVVVTQGTVKVSGVDDVVKAGQQVEPGKSKIEAAPRATHVLDWTRELMAAAESPLVPCSKFTGGALVAIDPTGQEINLTLRKFVIDVHIEDGFARTTIDQTYFNNYHDRLEGTFYFPLPPDATLSRLAMYVDAGGGMWKLNEGGMAEREHARNVFEEIRYARRDPALLEWVDGSTFKMRVFPLEGRQEKRVILSYTQRLSSMYGVTRYRFPAGHNMELVQDWQFQARVKNAANLRCTSDSHPEMKIGVVDLSNDLQATVSAKIIKPHQDVTLEIFDYGKKQKAVVPQFSSQAYEDSRYLMVRYRPELRSQPTRERRDWVFLFESSANRDPLVARAQIDVIRNLLLNAEHDDTFAIVTAGTRVHMFDKAARPATDKNIDAAVKFLEQTHLIGALDLGLALEAVQPLLKAAKNPHLVHVGSGTPAMGELRNDVLAKMIPDGTRFIGVGVGKRWNRAYMKQAADRTAGHFTQINPDEPIAWKAFDLLATLNTPRLQELRVIDNAEQATFLTETTSLSQGEDVCAVTRIDKGKRIPERITVYGKLNGKPFERQFDVAGIKPNAGYLPRTWAKLELDRLLALDAEANKKQIIDLSMKSYVMSPFTSLLVLETDADYQRFKIDRGRKDHWAMYPLPEQLKSKGYEAPGVQAQATKKDDVQKVLDTILVRVPPRPIISPTDKNVVVPYAMTAAQYLGGYDNESGAIGLGSGTMASYTTLMHGTIQHGRNFTPDINVPIRGSSFDFYVGDANAPFRDSQIGGVTGRGTVDPARIKAFAESWGNMPPVQRDVVLQQLTAGMSQKHKDAIEQYFRKLKGSTPAASGMTPRPKTGPNATQQAERLALLRTFDLPRAPMLEIPAPMTTPATVVAPPTSMPMTGPVPPNPSGLPAPPMPPLVASGPALQPPPTANPPVIQVVPVKGIDPALLQHAIDAVQGRSTNTMGSGFGPGGFYSFQGPGGGFGGGLSAFSGLSGGFRAQSGFGIPPSTSAFGGRTQYAPLYVSPTMNWAAPGWGIGGPNPYGANPYGYYGGYQSFPTIVTETVPVTTARKKFLHPLTDNYKVAVKMPRLPVKVEDLPEIGSYIIRAHDYDDVNVAALLRDVMIRGAEANPTGFLYQRPTFSGDLRVLHDLTQYAPGLQTTWADIRAILEEEAKLTPPPVGTIDDAAGELIAKARQRGWQRVTYAGKDSSFTIIVNGAGHYSYQRTLPLGVVETVVCDGGKLLQLYPDIGLGAHRPVSRYHRNELADLVPWFLPSMDDLARGNDVKAIDESTVAIIPRGQVEKDADGKPLPTIQFHLVFAADGSLAERRLIEATENKIWFKEVYRADALVRYGADGKETSKTKLETRSCDGPNLKPNVRDLVVLPMPLRMQAHTIEQERTRGKGQDGNFETWTEENALALFASECLFNQSNRGPRIFAQRFHARGDKRLGFYTLLAASGLNAFQEKVAGPEDPQTPLAKFLAHVLDTQARGFALELREKGVLGDLGTKNSFLSRATEFHDLRLRWTNTKTGAEKPETVRRTVAFLKTSASPLWSWLVLDAMHTSARPESLKEAYRQLKASAGSTYFTRYETARAEWKADHGVAGFEKLFRDTVSAGHLPAIDADFRDALHSEPGQAFSKLMKETAAGYVKNGHAGAVLALVWQTHQLGETKLARELFDETYRALKDTERKLFALSGIDFLWHHHDAVRAEAILNDLLADKHIAQFPQLWRFAATLAQKRSAQTRMFACLEKALDLEYRHMPEVVDVQHVRNEYQSLLSHYQQVIQAHNLLEKPVSKDLVAKVVKAADRWRAIDPEPTNACQQAARILQSVGSSEASDLAWEYLTTPISLKPNEAAPWLTLAQTLRNDGKADLADRAYTAAFRAEPTNAQILWDHAQYLQTVNQQDKSQALLRQLVNGEWQSRFQGLRGQAQQQLRNGR